MQRRMISVVPRTWVIATVVSALSSVVMGIVSIQYANYVDQRSNQRLCGVVVISDDSYKQTPPQTDTGIQIAKEMDKLRKEYHC